MTKQRQRKMYWLAAVFALVLFSLPSTRGWAQEVLSPSGVNPLKRAGKIPGAFTEKQTQPPLSLPFRDDFSHQGPWPDPHLWSDARAFINAYLPLHPRSVGVATLDALNEHGLFYEHIQADNQSYAADHLSSRPINLSGHNPADSVLLSFYYQPQGRAGDPALNDSLLLQFLHTPAYIVENEDGENDTIPDLWVTVWKAMGESLSSFSQDTFPFFRRVVRAVDESVYFREDFRFRFVNHVSFPIPGGTPMNLSGSRSSWHIDYVLLDAGRSSNQTNYHDICFVTPAQSLLNRYHSMPWNHYIADADAQLRTNFSNSISNLDNITRNYTYRYFIQDESGTIIRNYSAGTWFLDPFSSAGYQSYQPHANPVVAANPLPLSPAQERRFRIVHALREGATGDGYTRNDTIVHEQFFGQVYAYDKGLPETGYSLIGTHPEMALQFVAARPDSLKAVRIWFNETVQGNNAEQPFFLSIYKKIGQNEVILYQEEEPRETPERELMNRFTEYILDQPVWLADTFYVGIYQAGVVGPSRMLHIGFDISRNAMQYASINVTGQWEPSMLSGAPMIRPVFGEPGFPSDVNDRLQTGNSPLKLYPNPLSQSAYLNVLLDESAGDPSYWLIEIYDMSGRRRMTSAYQDRIPVNTLSPGAYVLRLIHRQGSRAYSQRFLIQP